MARDRGVNEIAMPLVRHPDTLKKLVRTRARLADHRALPDLLRDAVRPTRAVAFERLPRADALRRHPGLAPAYRTMHAPPAHFAARLPGDREARKASIRAALARIQAWPDAGDLPP